MHLISLRLHNFRVLKDVYLEFPDNIIGIIGPNGAGKSSIIEAVAWVLYGHQAARSGKDEIKSGFARAGEDCEVELAFNINGEPYRMLRRLAGRSERPEVELYRNDASESVGSTVTKKYIEQLLGLDWRGFLTSFLARQQELNALSDLQPFKRREHLAGMLGIEKLDHAVQQVKNDNRLFEEKVIFLQKQIAEKEQVVKRLGELAEHDKKLAEQVESDTGAFTSLKQDYDAISLKYNREHEKKTACSELNAHLEATLKTRANLTEHRSKLAFELKELNADEQEAARLQTELDGFEKLKKSFEQLKEAKNKIRFFEEQKKRRDVVKAEKERLKNQSEKAGRELEKSTRALNEIPADIEKAADRTEQLLNEIRDSYAALNAEKEARGRELAKLRGQISSIREIGPDTVCDRCHRPFGDDLPKIKRHLEQELNELLRNFKEQEKQLAARKAEGLKQKELFLELDRRRKLKFELTPQRDAGQKEIEDIKERLGKFEDELRQLEVQLAEQGRVVFDPAEFERVTTRVDALEKKQTRFNQLQGGLKRIPAVKEGLAETDRKTAGLDEEIEKYRAELKSLDFSEEAFEQVKHEFETLRDKFEEKKTGLLELNKESELVKKEIQLKEEQLAGFEKTERELEECRTGHYYGEKLGKLFTDFRKYVIASIRPRLAELSGELLGQMTDGRFSMVELDENYNLQVMDYGQFFGVERFSGGEKDLANLCLRLAISLALTESAGLDRSFVILDEVFGSQDNERKELILKGLANLRQRFPQMLLVTHIEELKHKVETLIEVSPTGAGWSEVRVNGTLV